MSIHIVSSHIWCTLSHAHILYKWLCFCVLYSTVAVQHRELTNEDLMELQSQRKDKERQEEKEVTEKLKRFTMQSVARGLS